NGSGADPGKGCRPARSHYSALLPHVVDGTVCRTIQTRAKELLMSRFPDRSLLPADFRAKVDAGLVTNGQYHEAIVSFPTPALVDHAEAYLTQVSRDFKADVAD